MKRSIIKFIIPVILLKLSDRIFRVIYDSICSRIEDNLVLASYSSIGPILELTGMIISGLSFGGSVYYNSKKNKTESFNSALYSMLIVTSLSTLILFTFNNQILDYLKVSDDLYTYSKLCLKYSSLSIILNGLIHLFSEILIIEEKTIICFKVNIVIRVIKIFMFLFCNTVEQAIQVSFYYNILNLFVISFILFKELKYKIIRVKIKNCIKIISMGIPIMMYSSCYPLGNFSLTKESNLLGIGVLASASVISTIESVIYCFYDATWNVVSKYVSDFIREKKLYKLKDFLKDLSIVIIIYHTLVIIILELLQFKIFNILGLNKEYFTICSTMMSLYLYTCVLDAFADIMYASLNTIKEVRLISLFPLFTIGLSRLTYIEFFYEKGNVSSLYLVYLVSYIINLTVVIFIFNYFTKCKEAYKLK